MNKSFDFYITIKEISDVLGITMQATHKMLKENNIRPAMHGKTFKITPEIFDQIRKIRKISTVHKKILISCLKGGVGKTFLTHALSIKSSMYGQKTLVIDLDQQANLTKSLGRSTSLSEPYKTLRDSYTNNVPIHDLPLKISDYLDLIPSNLQMAKLESEFSSNTENLCSFFNDFLSPIEHNYDVIFFDCPPSLGKIVSAAQAYSDIIICPVNTNDFSIDGLELTVDSITTIAKKFQLNPDFKIVVNNFDSRQKLAFSVLKILSEKFAGLLTASVISTTKQIDNCFAAGDHFWSSKFKSPAQENVTSLFHEIFEVEDWKESQTRTFKLVDNQKPISSQQYEAIQ